MEELRRRMEGALSANSRDLSGLRTGRASASMLDPIKVNSYGTETPINQVANVNTPEPRMLHVQVWDKELIDSVVKAIISSDLGLNAMPEGNLIRVPVPELSEERREEIVKVAAKYTENAKVAIRNIRRDGLEELKKQEKNKEISEDEHRSQASDIQKLTDEYIGKLDDVLKNKQKEIMNN